MKLTRKAWEGINGFASGLLSASVFGVILSSLAQNLANIVLFLSSTLSCCGVVIYSYGKWKWERTRQ